MSDKVLQELPKTASVGTKFIFSITGFTYCLRLGNASVFGRYFSSFIDFFSTNNGKEGWFRKQNVRTLPVDLT